MRVKLMKGDFLKMPHLKSPLQKVIVCPPCFLFRWRLKFTKNFYSTVIFASLDPNILQVAFTSNTSPGAAGTGYV